MARRITQDRVIASAAGGVAVAIVIGLFSLLTTLGVMDITSYSANEYCGGDIPCVLYLNGTMNEDVFIYPMDPTAMINANPGDLILEAHLYRSWGDGWKEFPLNETCTGTWCGASDNKGVAYVAALRKDREYQLKFIIYKPENATINWSINPNGVWLPLIDKPVNKIKIIQYCDIITHNYTQVCDQKNNSCKKDEVFYWNQSVNCTKLLQIGDKTMDYLSQGLNCHVEGNTAICDTFKDGNGDGYCQEEGGETCIKIFADEEIIVKNSDKEFKKVKGKEVSEKMSIKLTAKVSIDDKAKYKSLSVAEEVEKK